MTRINPLLLAIVMMFAAGLFAQEHAAPAKPPEHGQAEKQEIKPGETPGGTSHQLAEKSKEAAHGEAEGGHAEFKESPSVKFLAKITGLSLKGAYWLAVVLNFLIIAVLIGWALKKNLPASFRARTASIRKTMEEAQAASADANRRLSDIEGRLAKLDQEIVQMRTAAETEAAADEQRIQAAAEEDSRKIVESAQAEIESAARAAQRDLKAYAAQLAISMAEQRMQVDANTDRQLVQRFSRDLATSEKETR